MLGSTEYPNQEKYQSNYKYLIFLLLKEIFSQMNRIIAEKRFIFKEFYIILSNLK
jgi:hypothetical protein